MEFMIEMINIADIIEIVTCRVSIQGVKSLMGIASFFRDWVIGNTEHYQSDRWHINKGLFATCQCQCPRCRILEK